MVAAAIIQGSSITLKDVRINPGHTLVLDVLSRMNADIKVIRELILYPANPLRIFVFAITRRTFFGYRNRRRNRARHRRNPYTCFSGSFLQRRAFECLVQKNYDTKKAIA